MIGPNGSVELCPGCPMLPEGVRAELVEVRPLTPEEQQDYLANQNSPYKGGVATYHVRTAQEVIVRVLDSSNPEHQVGDELALQRSAYGRTGKATAKKIEGCEKPQPRRTGIANQLLGPTCLGSSVKLPGDQALQPQLERSRPRALSLGLAVASTMLELYRNSITPRQ